MEPALEWCFVYSVTLHWRKLIFPFPVLLFFFFLRVGLCVHSLFSVLRFCLAWTCAGLWVPMWIGPVASVRCCFLGDILPPIPLRISSPPLLHRFLSLERRVLMKTSNLGLSVPKFCPVVSHCVDSHLLQREAALMRAGGGSRGSHLWRGRGRSLVESGFVTKEWR